MCALSYFLEREGIMTTGISLVRENTESMQPPRALWVSFPLGRPLGVSHDAAFQHRVIGAALNLLERNEGPVLEDYPDDAPTVAAEQAMACPVSFGRQTAATSWKERLQSEIGVLAPWYELGLRRRDGRTLVGVSKMSAYDNIVALGEMLDAGSLPEDKRWFKHAIEDLKSYYLEAMTAQPGDYDPAELQEQLWQETALGGALREFFHTYQGSGDVGMQYLARMIAPREAIGGSTGPQQEEG